MPQQLEQVKEKPINRHRLLEHLERSRKACERIVVAENSQGKAANNPHDAGDHFQMALRYHARVEELDCIISFIKNGEFDLQPLTGEAE